MQDWVGLVEGCRKAAGRDRVLAGDDELFTAAVAVAHAQAALDVAAARVLAEIDGRAAAEVTFGLRTGSWLAREANLSVGGSNARTRAAVRLARRMDGVLDAVADGRISWDHARVFARAAANPRIVDAVAELVPELLDLARATRFEEWARQVAGIVDLLDQDGGHDPNDDIESNHLSIATTLDGLTSLRGTFTGDNGAVIAELVEAKADELFRRFTRDRDASPDLTVPTRRTRARAARSRHASQPAAIHR